MWQIALLQKLHANFVYDQPVSYECEGAIVEQVGTIVWIVASSKPITLRLSRDQMPHLNNDPSDEFSPSRHTSLEKLIARRAKLEREEKAKP